MLSWLRRHRLCFLVSSLLVVLCAFLLYAWVDLVVSLDYAQRQQDYLRRDMVVLRRLLLETGKRMNRSEIEQLVAEQFGKDNIKMEGPDELSILESAGIGLKFRGDSLEKVTSWNEDIY